MSAKRELRPEAIAKRLYVELWDDSLVDPIVWDDLGQAERQKVVDVVKRLIDEHVILPGWVLR